VGRTRDTSRLTEGHQIRVPCFPVAHGQKSAQGHLGFKGCCGLDQPETVRDSVNVDIDADGGLVKAERHDQVSGFASNSRQFAERFDGIGEHAAEFCVQDVGEFFKVSCFVAVKANGVDRLLKFGEGDASQVCWLCDDFKEASACGGCAGVLRARAQNRSQQDAKRVARLDGDKVNDRRFVGEKSGLKQTVDGGDV